MSGDLTSIDCERSILSIAMRDRMTASQIAARVRDADFTVPAHVTLWRVVAEMASTGVHVDEITVVERLAAAGSLDAIGGPSYVGQIMDYVGSTVGWRAYADTLADLRTRRDLRAVLSEQYEAATDRTIPAAEYADGAVAAVLAATHGTRGEDVGDMASAQAEAMALVERRARGERVGVLTPWLDLNDALLGLEPDRLHIIAARPAMGKSIMGLDIARGAAGAGVPAVMFSLEMSRTQLTHRLWSSELMIPLRRIRSGHLQDRDRYIIERARPIVNGWPLVLDDTPSLTVAQVRARARRYAAEGRCQIVVVDYLQLMAGGGYTESRERDVSDMSRGLKALARELHIPVVALSQLNRNVEQRADKRPLLSDLRESGAIEQDADVVLMLYRPAYYAREGSPEAEDETVEVLIRKVRDGDPGALRLRLKGECVRLDPFETRHDN